MKPSEAAVDGLDLKLPGEFAYRQTVIDQWPDDRTLRVFEPPKPVLIDMAIADPSCGRSLTAGGGVSLRVRASGARIEPTMPAFLLAWLQVSNGLWRGICQMRVESANHVSSATITMWVPPEALHLREEPGER